MKVQTSRRLGLVAGLFLAALVWSASANAGSLRQGSTGSGSTVTGSLPGEVLWTYYQTAIGPNGFQCPPESNLITDGLCETAGVGDNILRLINPNGGANGNLAGAKEQTVCAMIYVFDDDEEMGECCGCPLSSAQLATFSVEHNLTSNWGLSGGPENGDHANGSIAIIAADPNTTPLTPGGGNEAANCLGTACCDPTNTPGYPVAVAGGDNLLGSITHNQTIFPIVGQLTETRLFDDCHGEDVNLVYLQNQCGALIGNGSHGGICNCPIE